MTMCHCEACRSRQDSERRMWLAIRRGLLAIVKAIDVRYGATEQRQDRAA